MSKMSLTTTFRKRTIMNMTKMSHDSETLAVGQQVITACAFIHRFHEGEHEVFLPRRAATKKFLPGKYELVGGHIDYGEDVVAGLKREVHEELGVEVSVGDPFAVFTYVNDIKQSHSIEVVYFATIIGDEAAIELHPEDHDESGWFREVEATTINNDPGDEEVAVMKKGFALLHGEAPNPGV